MWLESLLAYAHLTAILAMVVFLSSATALCRAEWINAAVVHRLVRVDTLYWAAAIATLLTGIVRMVWGLKGLAWYAGAPLLHVKWLALVVLMALSLKASRRLRAWAATERATGALPAAEALSETRRRLMLVAHLLVLVPLAAVFLARGLG